MSVSTRRERRQQERRQQRRAGGAAAKRGPSQLWIGLGAIGLLVALFIAGRAMGVFEPAATSGVDIGGAQFDPAGQTIGQHMPDLGNAHIASGQPGNYTSLPPTSGEHYAQPAGPAPWGVKTTWLPFEVTTHNLEHGGVVIVYRGLADAERQQLTGVVNRMRSSGFNKIILEPYPELQGGKIALTAWNWILKLDAYDEASIVKFVRAHTDGEAPENGTP